MKSAILLVFCISLTLSSKGQAVDCKKMANQTLLATQKNRTEPISSLLEKDLVILSECANLDEIDLQFFTPSYLGTLLVSLNTNIETIKYKTVIKSIQNTKQQDFYIAFKNARLAYYEIGLIEVNKNTLIAYADKIEQIMLSDAHEIEQFKQFALANIASHNNFAQLLALYFQLEEKKKLPTEGNKKFEPYPAFQSLEHAQAQSQKDNKPVLIYFSSLYSVNSRQTEKKVLSTIDVGKLIADSFIVFQAETDDNSPSSASFIELQSSYFNNNGQPYFVIIDKKGIKLIQLAGGQNDSQVFINFLKEGLALFTQNDKSNEK